MTLRVSYREDFKMGALPQISGKISVTHLKHLPKSKKSLKCTIAASSWFQFNRPVKILTRARAVMALGASRTNRAKTVTLVPPYVWITLLYDQHPQPIYLFLSSFLFVVSTGSPSIRSAWSDVLTFSPVYRQLWRNSVLPRLRGSWWWRACNHGDRIEICNYREQKTRSHSAIEEDRLTQRWRHIAKRLVNRRDVTNKGNNFDIFEERENKKKKFWSLPEHQQTSFLDFDVSNRIALTLFRELLEVIGKLFRHFFYVPSLQLHDRKKAVARLSIISQIFLFHFLNFH